MPDVPPRWGWLAVLCCLPLAAPAYGPHERDRSSSHFSRKARRKTDVHKLKGRESDFPHLVSGDSMRILKPLLLTLAMMLPVSPVHAQTPAPSRMPCISANV
jgi:hypothetical protein